MARLMPEADAATLDRAIALHKAGFYALRRERGDAATAVRRGESRDRTPRRDPAGVDRRGHRHGPARARPRNRRARVRAPFRHRQTADGHPSKPHPSMLLTALAETGVAPGRAVMVGDTTYDIEMAANAGIAGIGVAGATTRPRPLLAAGARTVVDDFAGLARALDAFREEHA
ncbi:MAG: HAD-IA family hydrolase [Paracoccaceae bacterium]